MVTCEMYKLEATHINTLSLNKRIWDRHSSRNSFVCRPQVEGH